MDRLKLPDPGQNNLWHCRQSPETVFVFVHGIFSDSRSCWLYVNPKTKQQVYWPDLLVADPRFNGPSIFLGGYYTDIDAGPYEIRNCADELFRALTRIGVDGQRPVLQYPCIVFVCHSTGGIVVRYLLEKEADRFHDKEVGLVLIASPSYGSALASKLDLLSQFYNQQLGIQLQWGSWSLRDLDARFKDLVHQRLQIPKLRGVEAYENHFILHSRFFPNRQVVVTEESAGRYFGAPVLLRNTNHFSSVKPDGITHPAHELLVDFWSREFGTSNARAIAVSTNLREESAEQGVLYVHMGELVDAEEPSVEGTEQEDSQNRTVIDLVLRKHGCRYTDECMIAFPNETDVLEAAKRLFADLYTSGGDCRPSFLRIGVGYGSVVEIDGRIQGQASLDAKYAALDPTLDRNGLPYGIFVSPATMAKFGIELAKKFHIIQAGVGIGKSIYKVPLDDDAPKTRARLMIKESLACYDSPYIVCVGAVHGICKVAINENEFPEIGREIALNYLSPLMERLNDCEGMVDAMVNYLLFEEPGHALLAAFRAFSLTRDSESWHEKIAMKVGVSIHRGPDELREDSLTGTSIEFASVLLKLRLADDYIVISSHAFESSNGILATKKMKKSHSEECETFYFTTP